MIFKGETVGRKDRGHSGHLSIKYVIRGGRAIEGDQGGTAAELGSGD